MQTQAAVTTGDGAFSITTIEVGRPQPHEVLVAVKAAGICHTDWDSIRWGRTMVLGHEGAGVVEAVGEAVTHVKAGDPVLLNWAIPCGDCFQCRHGNYSICEDDHNPHSGSTRWQGKPIDRSFALGTMSGHTIVKKEAVIPIEVPIDFAAAAIVGCGVMTGYGSVVNAAGVRAGSAVVVIGCGGVGLNVIQGSRIAGAEKIIAIDLKPGRLEMARQFGATHLIQAEKTDRDLSGAHTQVKALTEDRGADYAFECTGVPALGATPLLMVRNAGTAIQVSGIEEDLTIDMNLFEWDKVYLNPLYGKCNPTIDFPRLFRLYQKGDLLLDELVTQTYPLDQLEQAFQDMLDGKNAKGVLVF
ncbi:alcohol dehydrogenase catalytic domain-containing protein [Flavilitoribacter nigricans]|uniref:Histidine kinase n=1 Tax=Flavilitoribacter nigricans (strain ATCC 23147 / DSM 23189 / NBRC 102662 / NCIMB 1420 / SS-2) TaxID=1122177 RepID=A0A2D0NC23_FLAN2|nr:alcohol dehydrogenase catalytic domain-containing protein [Flavilitoribacter nigricans]PHN06054.1 histidine kinase [Flavilitoribacter nigricans DSM 23189 = NBRC 102662]